MEINVLTNIKHAVERLNPGKKYKIYEYKNFYTAIIGDKQPMMFEKEHGFPMFKTFASMPASECQNPKLVYGGSK